MNPSHSIPRIKRFRREGASLVESLVAVLLMGMTTSLVVESSGKILGISARNRNSSSAHVLVRGAMDQVFWWPWPDPDIPTGIIKPTVISAGDPETKVRTRFDAAGFPEDVPAESVTPAVDPIVTPMGLYENCPVRTGNVTNFATSLPSTSPWIAWDFVLSENTVNFSSDNHNRSRVFFTPAMTRQVGSVSQVDWDDARMLPGTLFRKVQRMPNNLNVLWVTLRLEYGPNGDRFTELSAVRSAD